MFRNLTFVVACLLCPSVLAQSHCLTYLDEYAEPYYPGTHFPKLTTPQWVGEEGVDAVVTLGIDDMRDTAKYETYLRPILERLKKIDRRAPVSIMTCQVDPSDPQLKSWIAEGVSIEVHTIDHPCPCLQSGDFDKAKSTYDRCVDLMTSIPGNKPVAFRTPCCDSRNTPSPRLWTEIFGKRTDRGNFLQADSSVFNVFTADDRKLPRDLVTDSDGSPRFNKYLPFPSFVNTIENYPYPYVIGKLCWQFPCMVPSDWEAQNLHQPNNPRTVADMKAALDATVIKRGMFNLVFHPHGWIRNDQIVQLIDYAEEKYGKRVKFLNFQECVDRINQHLLLGQPIRAPGDGGDNGVRIVDLDQNGFLDVMVGNDQRKFIRVWDDDSQQWRDSDSDVQFVSGGKELGVRFGHLYSRAVTLFVNNERDQSFYRFVDGTLNRAPIENSLSSFPTSVDGVDQGVRLRDLNGDGHSEVLVGNKDTQIFIDYTVGGSLPFPIVDQHGRDNGVRFVDLDQDGCEDIIVSNGTQSAIRLYDSDKIEFSRIVEPDVEIPLIVRDGTNNGVWFADDHMWVQNEDTHRLPDGVDRRSFTQLLGNTEPGPRSPDRSLKSIQVHPGFTVELMAAEPLVEDPIAIDWGADGKLWVVEMADYPLGMDDQGKPGGRVRYLEDTNGDGKYDESTLFLNGIAFPTGVIACRDGVIVSAAPAVFFAADRNGDGVAEIRQDLYRGFGEGNQQHRVNGFERGLDNWLYLANGDSGGTIESVKTGKKVQLGGQDLRIRPADGSIDLQSGRTQFGRHRDDHGNWFGCSNPIPVRHFVLADHYLRRNPHFKPPPARRDIARVDNAQLFPISRVLSHWSGYKPPAPGAGHKFTSACSTMVYRDDLFGDDFKQNTFTCEPVHNAVHRRRLIPSGVTFESVRPEDESDFEFLASTDSWCRPTTVTTGPDGALWVVDMYRLVIEHPEWIDDQREKELFLRAGHNRGRIYRVYPTGRKPRQIQKLSELDSSQLVQALTSPNGRVRDLAQHLLVDRQSLDVVEQLEEMVRSCTESLGRLHALCTLDGIGRAGVEILQSALTDEDPTVRRHAIRISESVIDEAGVLETLRQINSSDPHVRMQLAYSLGESNNAEAAEALAGLAIDGGDDPYIRAAVNSSLRKDNLGSFYQSIAENAAANQRYRSSILEMSVRMKHGPLIDQFLTRLIIACEDDGATVDEMNDLKAALTLLRDRQVKRQNHQVTMLSCLGAEVVADLHDHDSIEHRVATISLLPLLHEDFRADVLSMLEPTQPVEVQVAAAKAIIAEETEMVLQRFAVLSPTVRATILDAALARESTALKLAQALKDELIQIGSIGKLHQTKMASHPSQHVKAAAIELFGKPAPTPNKIELIREYSSSLTAGDSVLGQEVFKKRCSQCHRVEGIGHVVGPDLAAIKNRSPQAMLTAILNPNAAVEDKYRSYTVLTKDGVVEAGIIASESSSAIQLHLQDGKSKTILREDIEQIQDSGKSLMPEEMEENISVSDMNHLIAFLNGIRPPAKQFTGNKPITVTTSPDGTIPLAATTCRIYGDQIRYEPQYKNVGYWGHPDDRVEWALRVEQPGRYEIWIDYACPDGIAGNRFQFTCGDQTLTGEIEGTGTWDDYRQVKLGTIDLDQATTMATFRSDGDIREWLLDLREITLKPQ